MANVWHSVQIAIGHVILVSISIQIFKIILFIYLSFSKIDFNISQDLICIMCPYLMDIGSGNSMIPNSMTHMVKASDPRIMDMMIAPQPESVNGVWLFSMLVRWGRWLSGRRNKLLGLKQQRRTQGTHYLRTLRNKTKVGRFIVGGVMLTGG
jgi:hypothetical protein